MSQAESYSQSIRSVGRQSVRWIQERADHGCDLFFGSSSIPHNRLLHFQGAVLEDFHSGLCRSQDGHSPRLPQEESTFHILGIEWVFYRHKGRIEFFDLFAQAVIDLLEALRKGLKPLRAKNPTGAIKN
jgi:hypothetical protein